jgi:chromosome segregation ATPase
MDNLVKEQKGKLAELKKKEADLAAQLEAAKADDAQTEEMLAIKDEQITELTHQIKQLTSVIQTTQIEIRQLITSREGLIARIESSASFYAKLKMLFDLGKEAEKEHTKDLDALERFGGAITVTIATIVEEKTSSSSKTTKASSSSAATKATTTKGRGRK